MTYPSLGFLQSLERPTFMAIFHAYFDESGKKGDHKVVTFSGVVVPETKLQRFDDEWNALLRYYEIQSLHMARASRLAEKHGPKMPRGQTADQRMDALIPFADCINDYLEIGLIQAWDVKGFNALSKEARFGLGSPDDPYYIAFLKSMMELGDYIGKENKVSVICDDDKETAWDCYRHYRATKSAEESLAKQLVSLSFANDDYFPALQAADMVAFLSRLEAKSRFYNDRYSYRRLFDYLITEKGVGHMKWFELFNDEAKILALGSGLEKVYAKRYGQKKRV